MSRNTRQIDPNQGTFDFSGKVDEYVATKQSILDSIAQPDIGDFECEDEANIMLAASVKKAQTTAGLSREQLCDGINTFFGRTAERVAEKKCRKPLSLDMLNNHLSKPAEYPMDAYLLFAIHRICRSLEPARVLAAAEGAQIASREEVRLIAMGKLDETMAEMQALKKQLKEGV